MGNQPPLPRRAVVKYIQLEEMNQETTLVPIETYGGETRDMYMGPTTSSYEQVNEMTHIVPEGRYQMDHNTLWFIANGMQRQAGPGGPRPYKGGPNQIAPPGPCYDCGGKDDKVDFAK